MNWRDKFTNFMYGRYGIDQLSRFMLIVTFILCILSIFIRTHILSILILALIIIIYYRMFSKKIYKRAAENEKYLRFINNLKGKGCGAEKILQVFQMSRMFTENKNPKRSWKNRNKMSEV